MNNEINNDHQALKKRPGGRWVRNTVIATATAGLVLSVGVGAVYAADASSGSSPSSSSSQFGSSDANKHAGHRGAEKILHGESVVDRDGKTVTLDVQSGTIESISDTSVTVKSSDGFSQSYLLNSSTKVFQAPTKPAATPKSTTDGSKSKADRPKPATVALKDLKVGDNVRLSAVKADGSATAERIMLAAK